MKELIKIESAPAKLGANFEEVKARLQSELAKYDVLVTVDTVPDAKKLATELNQTAKAIDDRRKLEVAAVSEPIRQFDEQMKELVTMCKDGRQKLLDQVKTFEDETRKTIVGLLDKKRSELWEKHGVEPEFLSAEFDDLVILTALTKSGNLTGRILSELEGRVAQDKALQDRTRMRLLELENASHRAGLSAPLTRDHVTGFLMADDDTYARELDRIINAEVQRQEAAERVMRERLEREQRDKEAREAAERERLERAKDQRMAQVENAIPEGDLTKASQPEGMANAGMQSHAGMNNSAAPDKTRVTVTATFHPEVPVGASDERIKSALKAAMGVAGITTLSAIEIYRNQ